MLIFYILIYTFSYFLFYKKFLDEFQWKTFTRIMSTFNALHCISFAIFNFPYYFINFSDMNDFFFVKHDLKNLYDFSAYLLVDGIFTLAFFIYKKGPMSEILSLFHHFIGSLGIFLIASNNQGFFLGWYFAMTELSTPFLNLSWYWRDNGSLFLCFYSLFIICRIFTIPFLLNYLLNNSHKISTIKTLNYLMAYYATYLLIFLNTVWAFALTLKILNGSKKSEKSEK